MMNFDKEIKGIIDASDNMKEIKIIRDKNKYFILISVADEPVFKAIDNQLKSMGFEDNQCLCMMKYIEIVPISFYWKTGNIIKWYLICWRMNFLKRHI